MNEEDLAQFNSWVQKATSFIVDFSIPGYFDSAGSIYEPQKNIDIYEGVDEKLYVHVESDSVPRFYSNFDLSGDTQLEIKEYLNCAAPCAQAKFIKGEKKLSFLFYTDRKDQPCKKNTN